MPEVKKYKSRVVPLLFILILVSSATYMFYAWKQSINTISTEALKVAETAKLLFSEKEIDELNINSTDVDNNEYQHLKSHLMEIVSLNKNVRLAYIYVQRSNKLFFALDSEPASSKDYSHPGQEYTEASPDYSRPFLYGKSLITKSSTDRWETLISVLVPIKNNETGKTVAVFAMDYPASSWNNEALLSVVRIGIITLAVILLFIIFVILNNNNKIKERADQVIKDKIKLETIVADIGDGIFVIDKDLKITLFNPKASEISGFSIDESLGRPYHEILNFEFEKTGEVNDVFIKQAFATGKIQEMAQGTFLCRKDGKRVAVTDSTIPLKDKNNNVIGCVVVFRDITKEKEIDRIKTEFILVASHQLKTPLSGIKWSSEILLGDKIKTPSIEQKKYLDNIHSSNERMIKLVNDLLNVSKIETGIDLTSKRKKVDIFKLVEKVFEDNKTLALAKNINIVNVGNLNQELFLNIDEGKIREVLDNLISNAIKYSKINSKVDISCIKLDNDILFSVKDDGIGIPKYQQKRIYEKFFRGDNAISQETDGNGLGLYIAKTLIEAHGGNMWFESGENEGTKFYFSLPIY